MPSVIVTLSVERPGTLEATSWAIPFTALGSRLGAESSTEALAGCELSANSWSCWLGMASFTCAESTPWICSIVWSS